MENTFNIRNRIIVIVDLSPGSENLIEFGIQLSKLVNAKLVFVHEVIGMFPALTDKESRAQFYQIEIGKAKQKLIDLVQVEDFDEDKFVVSHKPVLSILDEMRSSFYYDWVVGGLKDSSLLKRILFGSTFIKIINNSDLLTIAVPMNNPVAIPKKIVIAVAPKYAINESHLLNVLSAFQAEIKEVEFLSILDEHEDDKLASNHLLQLQEKYLQHNSKIKILKGADKYSTLKAYIAQAEHSFLILQEGSRSIIDEFFRKYMINEIIHTGKIPLIVLPNE